MKDQRACSPICVPEEVFPQPGTQHPAQATMPLSASLLYFPVEGRIGVETHDGDGRGDIQRVLWDWKRVVPLARTERLLQGPPVLFS